MESEFLTVGVPCALSLSESIVNKTSYLLFNDLTIHLITLHGDIQLA